MFCHHGRVRCENAAEPVLEWTAGAVARHLGVAASTLRSWSRRYGLGPEAHAAGRHRRFGAEDIARLEAMSRLVAGGVAPSAAARWVQTRSIDELANPEPSAADLNGEGPEPAGTKPARARVVSGVVSAALRLDSEAIAAVVARELEELGVLDTWNGVCLPAVEELGSRVAQGVHCVDAEHLLSWTITAAMSRVPLATPTPGSRAAVLACAEDEHHTLGLDALRAGLAERGCTVRMLGADTPAGAVAEAVRRSRPGAVVVWSQTPRSARPAGLTPLADIPGMVVVAAGAGWAGRKLPAEVMRPDSLRTALLITLGATQAPVRHSTAL
jgi:MerR family transcriptional regulator, light-induced transcriptional regulator